MSIRKAGVHVSGATDVNFVEGSGITLSITEDQTEEIGTGGNDARTARTNEVTIQIDSAGGAPSGAAGGDLSGTYPDPSVQDDSHAHTSATAPGTAHPNLATHDALGLATDAELATHAGAADPHTGYRLESADHTHATSGLQAGQVAHSALSGITATDHHAAPVAGPDANITVDSSGAAGTASTFARSGHGHQVVTSSSAAAAVGTAAAGTSGTAPSRGDHVHPTGAGTPTNSAVGDAAATGTGPAAAMTNHVHGRESFGASAAAVGTSSAGSATTPSRSDHVHATGAGTPSTQAIGDAAAVGTGPAASMTDHKHAMPAFGTGPAAVGTQANGSSANIARIDHVHATGAGTPSTQAFGDAAAVGTGPAASMTDHKHAMPAATVTNTFWVSAQDMTADGATSTAHGTAPDVIQSMLLADAATQGAYFHFVVPNDWSSGVIQYTIYWAPGSADATPHTVRWSTDVLKIVPGTTSAVAAGTTTAFTGGSAARTTAIIYTEAAQTLVTPTAVGDIIRVNIRRLGADAADTYVGAVRLHSVLMTYTATR